MLLESGSTVKSAWGQDKRACSLGLSITITNTSSPSLKMKQVIFYVTLNGMFVVPLQIKTPEKGSERAPEAAGSGEAEHESVSL